MNTYQVRILDYYGRAWQALFIQKKVWWGWKNVYNFYWDYDERLSHKKESQKKKREESVKQCVEVIKQLRSNGHVVANHSNAVEEHKDYQALIAA